MEKSLKCPKCNSENINTFTEDYSGRIWHYTQCTDCYFGTKGDNPFLGTEWGDGKKEKNYENKTRICE